MRDAHAQHAAFALTLHRLLAAGSPRTTAGGENRVCSPWSVSAALAGLAAGADEPTRAALADALAAGTGSADPARVLAASAATLAEGAGPEDKSVLAMPTTLWVDRSCTPAQPYTRSLAGWPGSRVATVPLFHDPEGTRSTINADVAQATRDLVPEILPAGSVTSDERALLVHALYLLSGWLQRFDPDDTDETAFHSPDGELRVPAMRGVREVPYAATSGWRYAALPLGMNLHAELLLPDGDLREAEAHLDGPTLARVRKAAADARVTLTQPRFRVEGGGGLADALVAMGLGRLFDAGAEPLPHVVEEGTLFLSGAFHQAVLRLDESGVEGGAATALPMALVAFRELPQVRLTLDRPFLVLVTHRQTGAVLLLARVAHPG